MIPIHPQRLPGDPHRLRWIIPTGILAGTGQVVSAPEPLAGLLADGTLAEITVEPAAVVTRLCPGRGWTRDGARVRTAMHSALAQPTAWALARESGGQHDDALLHAAARELLDGPVGAFARSHGGTVELVDVHDGVVTVRLGGTCNGCPAARMTLHQRLERQLRQRCPQLRQIRNAGASRDQATRRRPELG